MADSRRLETGLDGKRLGVWKAEISQRRDGEAFPNRCRQQAFAEKPKGLIGVVSLVYCVVSACSKLRARLEALPELLHSASVKDRVRVSLSISRERNSLPP
jgi:hypothetical protein